MFARPGGPPPMIAHHVESDKARSLAPLVEDLVTAVHRAAQQGTPAHEVEANLWQRVLAIGHQALALFFHLQGTGDLGDTLALPDGTQVHRLSETHARAYRSVFGDFTLH